MRTHEQITAIKNTQGDPKQLWDILHPRDVDALLEHYNTSNNVEQKTTGPKVLYVKEGEGVIDHILKMLRHLYGNFSVRSAHYFDVTKPHIIGNLKNGLSAMLQSICYSFITKIGFLR